MFIGLTGSLCAGKGVVSDFFQKKGFVYLSLSDELREIAKKEKIELTRKNLQNLGNQVREENGINFLAKLAYDKIINQQYSKAIIDGIRNPGEIVELRNLNHFYLISVDAPAEIRFERMLKRDSESDPKTLEDFLEIDARDKGAGELESGQGVGKCMLQADFELINEGALEYIEKKLHNFYIELERKIPRPTWDEYFMKIAAIVAERSTCLRHHVGAVIVKDKRVLTTGYNGACKNQKDCTELGCYKDDNNIESGNGHDLCRAIHAEQNAIIQAGYHGINIKDSQLYSTHTPCGVCAKIIVNAGIKEVVSYKDYSDVAARNFLEQAGVTLRKIKRPLAIIRFKD